MRLDSLPSGDPAQGHELAERSAEDRARPPKNADPANEGLARDAENGA